MSVATQKKEWIGDCKNGGQEGQPQGEPEQGRVPDFIDRERGKVAPEGVYEVGAHPGGVSVGIDHDPADFAVESIRRGGREMGRPLYPQARRWRITADGGGSHGSRVRLGRVELQTRADELQMAIQVCHFPPATSQGNQIEHRMFCPITHPWRGRPWVSRGVGVNLMGRPTPEAGRYLQSPRDENTSEAGLKVSDEALAQLALERDEFHGEGNYRWMPREQPQRS
jgi:hypothetical protein